MMPLDSAAQTYKNPIEIHGIAATITVPINSATM